MDEDEDQRAWAKVNALLDRVLQLPEQQRAAFLDQACADDPSLRAEVDSLLAAADEPEAFIDRPAQAFTTPPSQSVADPDLPQTLQRVGNWRLIRRLGRGGMGEVFEASRDDGQFEQRVAIKLIRADIEVPVARFAAERQILARLDHPGIARLIDGGVATDGRPYMVVELVIGETLRDYCAGRTLDLDARLSLFRQIAEAVRYAHRHLVIHRDLKPANVLVDVDGRARLLDFGIATLLEAPGTTTAQTRLMVTPEYAAPEQLRGEPISTATDVYALGLLLHELLTGLPPRDFSGLPMTLAIRQVLESDLPAPSASSRVLPAAVLRGDLDAIVTRALRSEVPARYGSVDALLDELDRWQRQQPVLAREGSRSYVVGRFLRRHRVAAVASTILAAMLVIGIAAVLWQAREASQQRDLARTEAARANAVRDYVLLMFRTVSENADGNVGKAQPLSARDVLKQAASEVRQRFAGDPAAARSMLLALAELNYELRDGPSAEAVLREFLAMPGASPLEAALARARLANVRYNAGDAREARALLDASLPVLHLAADAQFDRLTEARVLDAILVQVGGDVGQAIRLFSATIEKVRTRQGEDSGRLVDLYNELGNAQLVAQQMTEAAGSFRRSLAVLTANRRADSLDAMIVQGNLCDALQRGGNSAEARSCFGVLVPRQQGLYGESQGLVSPLLGFAIATLDQADPAAALPILEQAATLARHHHRPEAGIVRVVAFTRAEALLQLGRVVEAQALVEEQERALSAPASPDPFMAGMVAAMSGRIAVSMDNESRARSALATAEPLLAANNGYHWHGQRLLRALRQGIDQRWPRSATTAG